MKRFTKPRFLLVYPIVIGCFLWARTTEWQLRVGIAFLVLGMGLRWWANGYVGHHKVNWTEASQGKPKIGRLITGGPYAYVRHPLYLGSLLIGIGFCVIVGQLVFALVALGGMLLVYRHKMAEEEATLRHEWGEVFAQYRHHVPRLLPTWRRYVARQGHWSWEGIIASKELRTSLWVAVLVIALYFREELVQQQESLLGAHAVKHVILLIMLMALMLSDGMFELARRRKRRHAVHALRTTST